MAKTSRPKADLPAGDIKKHLDLFNEHIKEGLTFFYLHFFEAVKLLLRREFADIDDIAGYIDESFILMWEKKLTFPSYNLLIGYVFRTARNRCLDELRRREKERQTHKHYHQSTFSSASDTDARQKEDLEPLIRDAVEKMPDGPMKDIMRGLLEGLDYKQLAEKYGTPPKTAAVYKMRGIEWIKRNILPVWKKNIEL